MTGLVEKPTATCNLTDAGFKQLLETGRIDTSLFATADKQRRAVYGDEVYIRGLIESLITAKTTAITAASDWATSRPSGIA